GYSWAEMLREEFAGHAREIFAQGFVHQIEQLNDPAGAERKSLNGLERFLALPIPLYLARSAGASEPGTARAVRVVCWAMRTGLLQGYGAAEFAAQTGWKILPRDVPSKRWAHCLPFLCDDHLQSLLARLDPGDFTSGVQINVCPVVAGIDWLLKDSS